ncbi:unnamed protein product (mitochondrion) [Plasmodiophora brassicae]|uniref:Uncharacterized protein n=1 Tax=Plasmodiophora brassicae TaxID=37360 RepID=A0A0G4J3B6_PLABS|nr:hypothetical protein PBRA_008683 [Plasmodiophora brassicae]SPR01462.1 unnamed protein product [Plasmodiophora brassicae]
MNGNDDWQTVKSKGKKKERPSTKGAASDASAKPSKKQTQQQAEKKQGSRSVSPPKASAPDRKPSPDNAKSAAKKSSAKAPAAAAKPAGPAPLSTPEQMAGFIRSLIVNTPPPSNALPLAGVGEKIFQATKSSWNKKFKSKFGTIRDFVESQADKFAVVDETVYIKGSEPKQKQTQSAKAKKATAAPASTKEPAKKKANAAPASGARVKSPKRAAGSRHPAGGKADGFAKAVALAALVAGVTVFTLAAVDIISLESVPRVLRQTVETITKKR